MRKRRDRIEQTIALILIWYRVPGLLEALAGDGESPSIGAGPQNDVTGMRE